MLIEEWRRITIPEFSELYEVSSLGRIRSLGRTVIRKTGVSATYPPRIMKPNMSDWGYLKVWLTRDPRYRKLISIHRLVALEFVPNPDNLPEINHIDGVKPNNIWTNLEWATNEQNIAHSLKSGLCGYTPKNIREQIIALAGTASQEAIGQTVGVHQTTVSRIVRGVRGRHRIKQPPLKF